LEQINNPSLARLKAVIVGEEVRHVTQHVQKESSR